ncbi:uncharacterized protein [Haliotis cracherodii]|uniref:uncharacterized protein n=1 Tax=Haliotis cracherodii TaxID=6455 RepID=UPI0039EA934C
MLNYSGKPWANIETLSEAFKQVWKNKRDDNHRQITGQKEQHRINNRRNKRRTSKLKDRVKALEKSKRPDDWRRRAKGILTRECTSPDVSDEDDETIKLVLPLVWESPMMTDIKEELDIIRGKDMRQDHPSKMLRDSPSGRVPEWAIRGRYKEQRGNNLISRRRIPSTPESSPPSTPSTSSRATASSATFFSTPSDTSCQPDTPSTPSSTSSSSPPSTPLSTPTPRLFCDLSPVHKSKRRRSF